MQNNTPCLRDLIRARHLCEKNLSEALAAYIERPENERLAIAVNIAREELFAAKIKEDEYVEALFRYCAHLYKELGGVDIPFDDIL